MTKRIVGAIIWAVGGIPMLLCVPKNELELDLAILCFAGGVLAGFGVKLVLD